MTIANELRPTLFSEYIGQKGCINYLTSAIKHNKHSNGILITGNPGIGKSTAAYLYSKATLCENRKEGEFEPCNKCDSCLTKIDNMNHPNITYYRITEASNFKEAVNDLIVMTKAKPVLTHSNIREDNYRRFVIIDEIQNSSKQGISPFLDCLEFASKDVTIILISMDLNSMDTIVKDAIESRCIELSFSSLDTESISKKLTDVYIDLNKEAADLIAYLSRGNIRQAWSLLEYFDTQTLIESLSVDFIAEQKLNNLTIDTFNLILDSIETKTWIKTESLIQKYLKDYDDCVNYFLLCLLKKDLDIKGIELVSSLSFWLQSNYKIPLTALFRPYQNHKIQIAKQINEISTNNINKKKFITQLHSSSVDLNNTLNDIQNQLSNITGEEVVASITSSPKFLKFKLWKEFINNYVDNN